MATLVTGGTGTIGSNIVRELASRGHDVISFDIVPVGELGLKDVESWAGQVTWVQGDIVDRAALGEGGWHGQYRQDHPQRNLHTLRGPGEERLSKGRRDKPGGYGQHA